MKKFANFYAMKDVIGNILQTELKKEGMPTIKDFASMLGISSRSLYNVFNGSSDLTIGQLFKASDILKIDIIQRLAGFNLSGNVVSDPQENFHAKKKMLSVNIKITGSADSFKDFHQLLEIFIEQAATFGFRLT